MSEPLTGTRGGVTEAAGERVPVCRVDDIPKERGAQALVRGQVVAVFRTHDGGVFVLGNHDPFAKASVLSRGIVGTRGEVPTVSSPMYKHAFDLRTGQCLDEPAVWVPAYDVEVVDGLVLVGHRKDTAVA